jgi:hypothetical protein
MSTGPSPIVYAPTEPTLPDTKAMAPPKIAIPMSATSAMPCINEMTAALCDLDNPSAQARPAGAKRGGNPYAVFTSKVR